MNGRTVKPGIKEWRSWLLPSAAPCPLLPVQPRPPAAVADDGATQHQSLKKSFAKKLRGFDVNVLCYDILSNVGDANAKQVDLQELQQKADVLSLHIPWTPETDKMVNTAFINQFLKLTLT